MKRLFTGKPGSKARAKMECPLLEVESEATGSRPKAGVESKNKAVSRAFQSDKSEET